MNFGYLYVMFDSLFKVFFFLRVLIVLLIRFLVDVLIDNIGYLSSVVVRKSVGSMIGFFKRNDI